MDVKAPVVESIAKAETVFADEFVTYKKCSAGSIAIPNGVGPTANGDPGAVWSAPLPEDME